MADGTATRSSRGHRTICLTVSEDAYLQAIDDPVRFRRLLDEGFRATPELFPPNFALGYDLKDDRMSVKQRLPIRRIRLKDGTAYSVRPSFLMPYMTARVADVEGPLFLRKFGVPYWALTQVFGGNPMFWFRMECGLGRCSLVGTTVRQAELPMHLLADEHHQTLDGKKVYIATTVGAGCVLGAEPAEGAEGAGTEARDVAPEYAPKTVNTDGWKGTRAAWKALFPRVVLLLCFLHGWLKIRDRAKHLKDQFAEVSRRVWEAYHAPDRRCFGQRLRRAPGVGRWASRRGRAGERPGSVPQGPSVRGGVPSPRRPPHEQHARPPDAGDEPVLRPRPTPPRRTGDLPTPLPSVGAVVELCPVASDDNPRKPGLAVPGGATQPALLP